MRFLREKVTFRMSGRRLSTVAASSVYNSDGRLISFFRSTHTNARNYYNEWCAPYTRQAARQPRQTSGSRAPSFRAILAVIIDVSRSLGEFPHLPVFREGFDVWCDRIGPYVLIKGGGAHVFHSKLLEGQPRALTRPDGRAECLGRLMISCGPKPPLTPHTSVLAWLRLLRKPRQVHSRVATKGRRD